MTAHMIASTTPIHDPVPAGIVFDDPGTAVDTARAHLNAVALRAGTVGRVGLELEFHLVDLADPARRPDWDEVLAAAASMPPMPAGSSVTLEPGGQIELSTPPQPDIAASVAALRADRDVLRSGLARVGFGAAPLGTDPARPIHRVNPHGRYVAMEEHFRALGCAEAGLSMMTGTAALQVNLEAGPVEEWDERLSHIAALGPVLVALSAGSPYLGGTSSGWHSMRQQIWHGIDHGRSDPMSSLGSATDAWASYALAAPVMLVRDGESARSVTARVPFLAWLQGEAQLGRRPSVEDLDYHLTTLFPPVRPRGYIEIRCIDALPDAWWPALAAFTTTVIDQPDAAAAAREACAPAAGRWEAAARDGLRDPAIRDAVVACVEIAVAHGADGGFAGDLADDLGALAELVRAGRTPGDELRRRADEVGPLRLLQEQAHA